MDARPAAFWMGLGLKSGLLMLLLLPALRPEMEQYQGKGMNWRIFVFAGACFVIPVLWRLTGSQAPYPYLADNMLVLAPLTDVLWNTLDTYDRVWGWDKANHLVNSMIFAAVIGLWAGRYTLGAVNRFALALGLGMTLQVLWEIGEYVTFLARSSVANLYADTIGDLAFGFVGSLAGAGFAVLVANEAIDGQPDAEPAPVLAGS